MKTIIGIFALFAAVSRLGAAGPGKVRLITDWYPQPEHGGFYQALLKGYYRDLGLEVEIIPGGPNVFSYQRVGAKGGEFGMATSDDMLVANDRGIPLVAIGATMQHDPQAIMLHANDPVKAWTDLEGRTLAVTPGASWFQYLVKKYRLKSIRETPLTFSIGNFVRDKTYIQQCFLTSEPFFAKKAGVETRVMLIKDTGYDPYRVFFTRRDIVDDHPDWVRAFVTASLRGWRDYLADPTLVHARLKELNPEMEADKMTFSHKALMAGHFVEGGRDTSDRQGEFRAERWQFQFHTLISLGVIRGQFDLRKAYSTNFCNATTSQP